MYRKLSTLILSSLVLMSCASRMSHEESPTTNHEDVYPVIQTFVKGMTVSDNGETFMSVASLPFWVDDDWITEEQTLRKEVPNDGDKDFPGLETLNIRIYPLDDMSVLLPDVWQKMKSSPRLYFKDLYLGAVAIHVNGTERPESGFVLLRRVEGQWKMAGLIER